METPRTEAGDAISAYCMEPFKTLYVSRNGAAKPCCFGNPNAWYLGDVKSDDALAVWKGKRLRSDQARHTRRKVSAEDVRNLPAQEVRSPRPSRPALDQFLSLLAPQSSGGGNLRKTLDLQAPAGWRSIGKPAETVMQTRKEWLRERTSTASPADVWPMRELHDAGLFASTANGFVHRDLRPAHRMEMPVVISQQCVGGWSRRDGGSAVRHWRCPLQGQWLGDRSRHASPHAGRLLEGVRRSAGCSSMLDAFAAKKYKPVLRYDQESRANDLSGYDELIEKRIVGLRRVTWLPQKPIELILLEGAAKGRHFQQAFAGLAPGLVPARRSSCSTISIRNTRCTRKYSSPFQTTVSGSALIGKELHSSNRRRHSSRYIGDGSHADLSADLQVAFHQRWDIQGLSLDARIGLQLSYARLSSRKAAPMKPTRTSNSWPPGSGRRLPAQRRQLSSAGASSFWDGSTSTTRGTYRLARSSRPQRAPMSPLRQGAGFWRPRNALTKRCAVERRADAVTLPDDGVHSLVSRRHIHQKAAPITTSSSAPTSSSRADP